MTQIHFLILITTKSSNPKYIAQPKPTLNIDQSQKLYYHYHHHPPFGFISFSIMSPFWIVVSRVTAIHSPFLAIYESRWYKGLAVNRAYMYLRDSLSVWSVCRIARPWILAHHHDHTTQHRTLTLHCLFIHIYIYLKNTTTTNQKYISFASLTLYIQIISKFIFPIHLHNKIIQINATFSAADISECIFGANYLAYRSPSKTLYFGIRASHNDSIELLCIVFNFVSFNRQTFYEFQTARHTWFGRQGILSLLDV